MSIRAMEWVSEVTAGKSTDKAVLIALANFHHQKDGECRASVDTISSFTELNRKTVFAALDRLREGGLIDFDKGARRQRKYVLNFDVFSTKLGTIEKRGRSANFGTIDDGAKVPNTTKSGPSLGPNKGGSKVPNATDLKYQTRPNLVQDLGHTQDTGITQDNTPPIVPPSFCPDVDQEALDFWTQHITEKKQAPVITEIMTFTNHLAAYPVTQQRQLVNFAVSGGYTNLQSARSYFDAELKKQSEREDANGEYNPERIDQMIRELYGDDNQGLLPPGGQALCKH